MGGLVLDDSGNLYGWPCGGTAGNQYVGVRGAPRGPMR